MRNTTAIAAAAIAAALTLTGCGTVGDAFSTKPKPEPDSTVAAATEDPSTEEPAYEEEPDDPSVGLTAEVEYTDGTKVSLDKFTRGVSSSYGSPENAPYVKFTVKVVNGSEGTMDLGEMYLACQYGDEGQMGEAVYDDERGLKGAPMSHLTPGRSITVPMACELPKDESYVQIEVSAGAELETAIFVGDVE